MSRPLGQKASRKLRAIYQGNWTLRVPLWLQLTLFVFTVAFLSLLIMITVTSVKSWDYGSALMAFKLESVAAMKAVELQQSVENTQFDVSWMFSRDTVTQTLMSEMFNNATAKSWDDLSGYFNAMITSKQGYQAIILYDWNMTQVYSLEHSDSASSLTALLATMSDLLPLQQPDSVDRSALYQTGILQDPTAVVTKGKMVSYSYSITLPITVELNQSINNMTNLTNSTDSSAHRKLLVGYGTVVMSAQPLLDTEQISSDLLEDNKIFLGESARNVTSGSTGYKFLFPPPGASSGIYAYTTFPSMEAASELPVTTVVERARGSFLRTHTPFSSKESTGHSYALVLQRRWLVVVSIPQSVAYANVRHLRNRVIGTSGGILGALVLVIVPIGRAFTSSLYKIYNSLELRPLETYSEKRGPSRKPSKLTDSSLEYDEDNTETEDSDEHREPPDPSTSSQTPSPPSSPRAELKSAITTLSQPMRRPRHRKAFHLPQKLPRLHRPYVDELDELVEEYNKMIDKLSNQYMFLDDQVRARTQEAQEARVVAETANAAKSKFIANITHELRTPLNGIMGMTSISLSERNVDKIRNNFKVILDSGRVLMELLNELLTFSKNQIDLVPEVGTFTPAELIANFESTFSARADAKHLSVSMGAVPGDLNNLQLRGDSYRMFQIVINFMSNAIKFSDEHGSVAVLVNLYPQLDSRISCEPYKKSESPLTGPLAMLELSVTDHGQGMSERQLGRIFEPFTQGDESLSKRHQGTGLGMSMCKQLAEGIGGYVVVWSSEGHSSTALLRVPVQIVSPPPNLITLFYRPAPVILPNTFYTLSLHTGIVKKMQSPSPQRRSLTVDTRHNNKSSSFGSSVSASETPLLGRHMYANNSSTSLLFASLQSPPPPRTSNSPVSAGTYRTAKGASMTEKTPSPQVSDLPTTASLSGSVDTATPEPSRVPRSPADDLTEKENEFASESHPDIKVLVADDNKLNVRILSSMLERMGVQKLDTAYSGNEAISLVEKSIKNGVHYTIIFMDLVMPDLNGLEATQVIRGTLGYPYPIVALTGYSDQQTKDACEKANIQEVLVKPIMRNALVRIIIKYHDKYL